MLIVSLLAEIEAPFFNDELFPWRTLFHFATQPSCGVGTSCSFKEFLTILDMNQLRITKSPKKLKSIKAYMAGPDVFLKNATEKAEEIRTLCKKYGIRALIPTDNDDIESPKPLSKHEDHEFISMEIFKSNVALIDKSDFVIANLEPFRGPSADVGTVWEIGYAFAKGKTILAYTSNPSDYISRVPDKISLGENDWMDNKEMSIENFGLSDNLMIHHSVSHVFKGLENLLKSKDIKNILNKLTTKISVNGSSCYG